MQAVPHKFPQSISIEYEPSTIMSGKCSFFYFILPPKIVFLSGCAQHPYNVESKAVNLQIFSSLKLAAAAAAATTTTTTGIFK